MTENNADELCLLRNRNLSKLAFAFSGNWFSFYLNVSFIQSFFAVKTHILMTSVRTINLMIIFMVNQHCFLALIRSSWTTPATISGYTILFFNRTLDRHRSSSLLTRSLFSLCLLLAPMSIDNENNWGQMQSCAPSADGRRRLFFVYPVKNNCSSSSFYFYCSRNICEMMPICLSGTYT